VNAALSAAFLSPVDIGPDGINNRYMANSEMISVEEARERILAHFTRLPAERKPLLEAVGQVLAEDVVAPFDIPPLDNTGMDGYAVRAQDTAGASRAAPVRLRVTANLAAGYVHP
jgi:molybdopterin molybdotransferase